MAFAFTLVSKTIEEGGYSVERGTWTSDGGTTTGNITVDTGSPKIIKITDFAVSSNGDTTVNSAQDVSPSTLKITFTANDAGQYMIKGKVA